MVVDSLGRMGRTTGGRLRYRSSNSQAAKPTNSFGMVGSESRTVSSPCCSQQAAHLQFCNSASCLQPAWQVNAIASSALRISVCGVVLFGSATINKRQSVEIKTSCITLTGSPADQHIGCSGYGILFLRRIVSWPFVCRPTPCPRRVPR